MVNIESKTETFSYEQIMEEISRKDIMSSNMDPHEKEASEHIYNSKQEIIERVKAQTEYWTRVLDALNVYTAKQNGNIESMDAEIEHGDFLVICRTYIGGQRCLFDTDILRTDIFVVGKDWGRQRRRYIQDVFDTTGIPENGVENDFYSVQDLANKLDVKPRNDFNAVLAFDTEADSIKRSGGIDGGIKELIRLLNEIGIKTKESCSGHRMRWWKKPYMFFSEEKLRDVLALMLAWENVGGAKWLIRPYRDLFLSYVQLLPDRKNSLGETHKDMDGLTDFLIGKTGQVALDRLTPVEIAHRVRRKISRAVSAL